MAILHGIIALRHCMAFLHGSLALHSYAALLQLRYRHNTPPTPRRCHLRIKIVPKLLVLVSRHPTHTETVVTYESKWRQNFYFIYCKGRHVPKLSVFVSRHPASTVKVVTYESKLRRNYIFCLTTPRVHCKKVVTYRNRNGTETTTARRHDKPPTPRGSSLTNRNGAKTTILLASQRPASTVKVVTYESKWHRNY